ncbi:translocation/assembly module TamB [Dysgonomonas sp. ZJ709]|uniref:translocation/assembly module TamB domain-containing protein n=1 Tax=Dysgonomonas sp. ZJ709 TaxID=2709797 RepID=UPI002104CA9C|nr:translocation/assembly module TamB domain-containing protein [Dysgonomonas sp. ZJ709]
MGLITLVFGLLNMPAVQEYAKGIIVDELKAKIGTELGIGKLSFQPFNSIQLDSVYLYDQSNEKVLMADRISASIDLFALAKSKIVITSAWLSDFEVHLSKDSTNAPLNIQYIIEAFKSKDDKPKSQLDIKLSAVNISNGQFYYNVKDKPAKENIFDENHIQVSNLNAKIALKSLLPDSLNIQIKSINLKEKSGLEITNLTGRLITQDNKAYLRGFRLDMPSSFLQFDKCEVNLAKPADSVHTDILDYANLDLIIAPSYIAPKDVSAFVPLLKNFNNYVTLRGHISGTIDNLQVEDFSLDLGDKMHLISNVEIKDLRQSDKMYILGSIDNLTVSSEGIQEIVGNLSKNKNKLPKQITNLGTISFQGDISGYLNQLTAFGSLDTQLGIVKTDILFGINPTKGINSYAKGKVYTSNFDLGRLLDNKDIGKTSLNITVDLEQPKYGKLRGNAQGIIHDFAYKTYEYKDITFDADYDGLRVDGKLHANTPNGELNIKGLFDLSDKNLPELNFEAHAYNLELDDLKLADKLKDSNLSFVMRANFKGANIDDAVGYLRIDTLDFVSGDKHFHMNQFLIEASKDSAMNQLNIKSDILNGEVKGAYSFTTMANSVLQTLHPYLPALINAPQKKKPDEKENNLTFEFQINNSESLSNILNLPVVVLSPAKIIGFYNNVQDKFKVEVFAPSIKAAGSNIKSGYVVADNQNNLITTKVNLLMAGKNNSINDIALTATASNNLVTTNITFANDGKQKAKGEFAISTLFTRENKEPLQIDVDVLPSELVLNNAVWKMEQSHIHIQENIVGIDNFLVYNDDGSQEIKINGKYSNNSPKEILKTELKNINLEYIFQTLAIDVLKFGGKATGSLFLSSIEKKPYANTNLEVEDFKFNGTELGKLKLFSELDDETNKVILSGAIISKENKTTNVDGSIDPIKQALSINFDADSIDIGFLKTYAETIFSNISGRGTGKVHLFGNFSKVTVEGDAYIQDGNIGISFLNTNYSFSDTIHLKKDLIYFNDIVFTDDNKNTAIGTGKVAHDFFANFMYYVDLSANKFMVYNATEKQNPLFFGKVFGSGKGTISGDESAVNIDISMRTEENTAVRMNFMDNIVNEYTFITYKDKNAPTDSLTAEAPILLAPIKTESGMEINMNFYIDATPDAVVELVMDPVGGDILRGVGNGTMQFQWNSNASPRLYGTYNINRGNYNFTFQRLMERNFAIQDGSSVQFRGDPFEAILDVSAVYKITASLNDLDRQLAVQSGQTTIPVNCILKLSGPLKHPNVGLDISFPTADAEVERQVKSIINTEDMINKQVTYLLLLSKFYSPDFANTDQRTSDFAAVASATLSNQLSKIVNQVDKRWQLGTNIRTSDSEFTTTEVELILSSQLLNDRLLLNGNFGYRDDPYIKSDALIGDVDLEYLLDNSGNWRVKAYNHYNEKYYYTGNASQTQGVGIVYKKDFDKLKDLFIKPKNRLNKKDSIKIIVPDSITKGSTLSPFIKIKE